MPPRQPGRAALTLATQRLAASQAGHDVINRCFHELNTDGNELQLWIKVRIFA